MERALNNLQANIYASLPLGTQNLLCTIDGYRRSRKRFTPFFERTLDEWEASIGLPVQAHHAHQWTALKQLIERARSTTRYYRFLPDPIETGDPASSIELTLKAIPTLEKSVYRARTLDFLRSDMQPSEYVERSTSGTTGTALRIFDSHERFAENYAAVWRQRRHFGISRRDPFMAFTGQVTTPLAQQSPPYWRFDRHSQRTLFSIYHLSPQNLEDYLDPLHSVPASYAEGYPSALHIVGRAMLDANRPLPEGRLKAIFTSSESLLPHQRSVIEAAFNAPVRDHYASTEHAVSMTACAENRLHVDMEFGIVEVETEEETAEWVRGPLIVTGLGRPATPLIRYRIGDVGTLLKKPCACGRAGDVFLDIDGRIEDYITTPDGRLVGRMDHVFKGRYDIVEAQLLQNDTHEVEVLMVPGNDWNAAGAKSLERELRQRLGQEMQIKISLTDRVPREPNGKLRAVKSSIERGPS